MLLNDMYLGSNVFGIVALGNGVLGNDILESGKRDISTSNASRKTPRAK